MKNNYEYGTECSETLTYKIQTPGNYPEQIIQRSEQGESLKSRVVYIGLVGGTCRKETCVRLKHRWEDNIKVDLKEIGDVKWIDLDQCK